MTKRAVGISFPFLAVATALDLSNRLDIFGPFDENGFTPFDHGIFGTTVKILLCVATTYSLYVLISYRVKSKPLALSLTVVGMLVLVIVGAIALASIFWTF